MQPQIPALTGLRGVAAFWVLVFHVSFALQPAGGEVYAWTRVIGAAGFLGVDVFFVLSGFILAYNYSGRGVGRSLRSYCDFLWRRLARIYPLHVATLLVFLIFLVTVLAFDLPYADWDRLTWNTLIQNLMLTHAWEVPVQKSWNSVSWSISAEWAAYLCFPVIVLLASLVESTRTACSLIVLLFLTMCWYVQHFSLGVTMAYGLIRITTEFPAGVLLFRIWALDGFRKSPRFDVVALVALVALVGVGNAIAVTWSLRVALAVTPVLACVVVYSLAASSCFSASALSSRLMMHLGRISYAFYLVHGIALSAAGAVAQKHGLQDDRAPMFGLVLTAVLGGYACAVLLYRAIEVPARHWLVARSPARSGSTPAEPATPAACAGTAPRLGSTADR